MPVSGGVGSNAKDFTVSGETITARGYNSDNSAHELFEKNGGGDETGLGLVETANNELQATDKQYIQLDLRSILLHNFVNGKIKIGSVQQGESFALYGSNTVGSLGVLLGSYTSSSDGIYVAVPSFGTYQFVSVVATAADVLPVAFEANFPPCPNTD